MGGSADAYLQNAKAFAGSIPASVKSSASYYSKTANVDCEHYKFEASLCLLVKNLKAR